MKNGHRGPRYLGQGPRGEGTLGLLVLHPVRSLARSDTSRDWTRRYL